MQKIDQEKLAEFIHQLAEFQTEATKTASIDVYDRFTIDKLEDHIVDLYQLSIDASHQGLQFLCECMRDNIRDHLITGTNITNEEFSLMAEWKTLVKAYLTNDDNVKVIQALIENLSKSNWVSPLKEADKDSAVSVLLDGANADDNLPDDTDLQNDETSTETEFDAYIEESNSSLADVFQASDKESNNEEMEDISPLLDDDEPSLAQCFEELQSADDAVDDEAKLDIQDEDKELGINERLRSHEDVSHVHVSDEELSQITQASDIYKSEDSYSDADVEADDELSANHEDANQAKIIEHQLKNHRDVEKVSVSNEELDQIDEPPIHSTEDDDIVHEALTDEPKVDLANLSQDENIKVSSEELSEIDNNAKSSLEEELFVDTDEHVGTEYSEDFDKDLAAAEDMLAKADSECDFDISQKELSEIDDPAASSIEDEFKDQDEVESAEVLESSTEESVLSEEDKNASLVDELFVEDSGSDVSEYEEQFDKDLSIAINDSNMSIAEEALAGVYDQEQQYDTNDFVDTVNEPVISLPDENNESVDIGDEVGSAVQTVYIEPSETKGDLAESKSIIEAYVNDITADNDKNDVVEKTKESVSDGAGKSGAPDRKDLAPTVETGTSEGDGQSRSIIEAYVGVISSKQEHSKPDDLEQELIEESVIDDAHFELEPIEDILSRYSDWTDEQKELLSLIVSEVSDVIEQQDDVLSVLHNDSPNEEAVLEMVSLYEEQIDRMGSAAEMVGLLALQKLCELIGFHFGDLARSSTEMIVSSEERIRKWPFVIYTYLKDIYSEKAHEEAIEYISDDDWARTIREDIKSDLKDAFSQSTILVERSEDDQRLSTATEEHVNIVVPEDVQAELLDGLLQELPHQTEEFSSAIQQLVAEDYVSKLEVTQRIAHTIKGAANTVGIVGVATLTHQLEDILQALLKAQMKPSVGLHSALINASDCLEQMTECLLGEDDKPDDAVQTLQVILDWANYIDEFGPPKDDDSQVPASNKVSGPKQADTTEEKAKPSQEASLRVPANMIDELINQSGESIIANSQMHENVNRLLRGIRDIKKNREDVYSLSQQLEHMIDVQGTSDKFAADEKSEKFDPLEMEQYNELHTYSRRLIEATADSVELVKDLEERLYVLESVIADQSRAQKDNQYAILKTRMAPVDSITARLKRGVRQSAKLSQKTVELEVHGAETLLDSKILNNLVDPLMHLLRNAVDHGVESDEIRQQEGKSIPAIIKLSFEQVGERLEIVCEDDGQGLDAEKIQSRALQKGLIDKEQQLSEQEIHQIIMQHGFSTRDQVTQLSGRGVGMDVVYSNIKDLNGSVQIHSEKTKGMKVEMSLPVSLLTAHALLIPTSDGTMAVSASGIEEILQVNLDDLTESENGLLLKVENEDYAAIHLEQLLKTKLTINNDQQDYSGLLIENITGEKKVILVDEIQSVRDIIIKPFSHYLPKVVGLIGATVLGNGDVAAVVDVNDLLSQETGLVGRLNQNTSDEIEAIHQASVLVVEDSISTRRSLAEFMQDLNYRVFTAKDGVEAIEIMRQHRPNILLTDLEMPRMNGLELTSYIRSHDETKDIPIIMLTSRTTEKHKQEAKSIGVNEYLTKPYVEDILLEKVQHLSMAK